MQANILRIRKEYFPDNAGLQTIVYFCGCALGCQWCMHPMPDTPEPVLIWSSSKCLYCQLCVRNCPTDSLHFENDILVFDPKTCDRCLRCQQNCPAHGIDFGGSVLALDDAIAALRRDRQIYRRAGGLTLFGVNSHSDISFAAEILRFCRENGIRTCVDTPAFLSDFEFARLIQNADRVVIDLKHYDRRMHVRLTGVSNQQILNNLDFALAAGKDVIARIAVIPHINDTSYDAHRFGILLNDHGVRKVTLTNFAQLNREKYGSAHQLPNRMSSRYASMTAAQSRLASFCKPGASDTNISCEALEQFGEIIRRHGLLVRCLGGIPETGDLSEIPM